MGSHHPGHHPLQHWWDIGCLLPDEVVQHEGVQVESSKCGKAISGFLEEFEIVAAEAELRCA